MGLRGLQTHLQHGEEQRTPLSPPLDAFSQLAQAAGPAPMPSASTQGPQGGTSHCWDHLQGMCVCQGVLAPAEIPKAIGSCSSRWGLWGIFPTKKLKIGISRSFAPSWGCSLANSPELVVGSAVCRRGAGTHLHFKISRGLSADKSTKSQRGCGMYLGHCKHFSHFFLWT